MNLGILIRSLMCILFLGAFLYSYIEKQNEITELRLEIPSHGKTLEELLQETVQLQFEIDQFKDPSHLLQLARLPEYRHLKYPSVKQILIVPDERH